MHQLLRHLFHDERAPSSGTALSIGFGSEDELRALAGRGFSVIGIEKNLMAVSAAREACGASITIVHADIRKVPIEENAHALIVALNVLPFLGSPEDVFGVLSRIIAALAPEGCAVVTLFGPRDAWTGKAGMTFIAYDVALEFFAAQPVSLYFRSTEEGYGPMKGGGTKYWHIHRFIVQKDER